MKKINVMIASAASSALLFVVANSLAQDAPASYPRCSSQTECEALWSAAQDAVGLVSNMRIRLATESRIETFAPTRPSTVGATVVKRPVGGGTYEVSIRLECYGHMPCADIQRSGEMLFYTHLQSAKLMFKPHENKQAEAAASGPLGKDSFQAERMAKEIKCSDSPKLSMPAKGGGYEIYMASCTNGDTAVLRCEYGNCRSLK